MAVLSREDYLARIKNVIGEDTSDDAVSLIEDMTDTYDDMNTRLTDGTDWKAKYEENDKTWREKYTSRFFDNDGTTPPPQEEDDTVPTTFDDLFKEE